MALHFVTTILDSPFSFLGLGKEVAVELAAYKPGTYLGRPATLLLLKVSNNGRTSESVTDGYDFDLRLVEHAPRKAGDKVPGKKGVEPDAHHPQTVEGAKMYDRTDEDSLLTAASRMTREMSKHPTFDLVIPPAYTQDGVTASQTDLGSPPGPTVPRLPSNIPCRPSPLCVAWAPDVVRTIMFRTKHATKRRGWFKAKVGETDQLPAGVDAGYQATTSTSWTADEHYEILTRQHSDGVRFTIRGPGKKQTGLPPALLVGIVVCHVTPAQIKVYPSSRTVFKYVTIRKVLAVPTVGIHGEFMETCANSSCNHESCREFGRQHITDAMWRSLLGAERTQFALSRWAFRRP